MYCTIIRTALDLRSIYCIWSLVLKSLIEHKHTLLLLSKLGVNIATSQSNTLFKFDPSS